MKKIISTALAATLAISSFAAFAQDNETLLISAPEAETAVVAEIQAEKIAYNGSVKEIGEGYIIFAGETEIRFNISETTYVCDYNLNPVELKKDDTITVVASSAMTRSIPAQSAAYYILVRTDENAPAPIYAQVASNNGSEILSADGNNRIVFDENTPVSANKIRIALKGQDITVGSDIIAFSNVVGMSLPAHVPAEKIAVLSLAPVEETAETQEPATMPEIQADKLSHSGIVSEIGEGFFVIGEDEYQFNTDENTYVCDYDLNPVELKKDDMVTVVASAQMTMSLPPQSYALYVLVRTDENAPAPIYAQVASNNGSEILSADGNNRIVFDENTPVTANKIRIALKGQDITVGSDIIAFSNVVGMSLPAHVPAEKIAVLRLAPVETAPEHDVEKISIGENTYEIAFDYTSSTLFDEERLPLRAVCEAMGYTVAWNGADESIKISKDDKAVTLFVGKPMMEGCDEVPVVIDGTTYVSTKIFNVLCGSDACVEDAGNGVIEVR